MYTYYDRLSYTGKKCFNELFGILSKFQTTVVLKGYDMQTVKAAFEALCIDKPQLFWLSGDAHFTARTLNDVVQDVTLKAALLPEITLSKLPLMAREFEAKVNAIVASAKKISGLYGKVYAVHNYIVDKTDYDLKAPMCRSAYACLIGKRAVCAGYARAFMVIMERLGIPCGYVRGYSRDTHEKHGWNYVCLEGEYYFIDLTWDDPVIRGGGNKRSMEFFCITTQELLKTHIPADPKLIPVCKGTKYNYYRYNRFYLERYDFKALLPIATAQLKIGKKFTVKFGSAAEEERAYRDLIGNHKVFQIPGVDPKGVRYFRGESKPIFTVECG